MATQNLGNVRALIVSAVAPTNTNLLWRDTSVVPSVTKQYNNATSTWEGLATPGGISRVRLAAFTVAASQSIDWTDFHEIATTGDITVDKDSIWTFTNTDNAEIAVFDLMVTGATRTLTLPSGTVAQENESRYTFSSRQLELETGRYKMVIKKTGTVYTMECSDKYTTS